jgi:hypothetical protein
LKFRAGDDQLFSPCYVNLRALSETEVNQILDVATEQLGAWFFRDRDLFHAVLADGRERAADPRRSLAGPYLHLFVRPKGELGVTTADKLNEGGAVYAMDQLMAMASRVKPEQIAEAIQAALASQEPSGPNLG